MKRLIIILLVFLLIPLVTAGEFSIEIKPYYFKDGREIIYTPDIEISALNFEIVGTNNNPKFRILNLTIIDSYPQLFKEVLPENMIEMLHIKQTKILFVSQLIDVNDFNQTNIDFWVGIQGVDEGTGELIYSEGHLNLTIPKVNEEKRNDGVLEKIGKKIWPSNPLGGLGVVVLVTFTGIFIFWKYKLSDKLGNWRGKSEKKRIEKRQGDEGW